MRKAFLVLSLFAILAVFANSTNLATAKDSDIRERVFVHYPNPHAREVQILSCNTTTDDQVNDYLWAGWQMPTTGMNYKINYGTKPSNLTNSQIQTAVTNSFGTWSAADNAQVFNYSGTTTVKNARRDGTNAILWKKINAGALAITYVWYNTATHQLVEADTVYNKLYAWTYTDPAAGDCAGTAGTYDLQNIGTHEFGHWIGLDDLYNSADKDLTMYGYGDTAELKKNTLGVGDITGTLSIAP